MGDNHVNMPDNNNQHGLVTVVQCAHSCRNLQELCSGGVASKVSLEVL